MLKDFEQFIDENRLRPFEYGSWDCGIFVAGALKALTGVDYLKEYTPNYTTATGAKAWLNDLGHSSVLSLVRAHCDEIPVSFARCGDLCAIKTNTMLRWGLGIVLNEQILVLRAEGLGSIQLLHGSRAFRAKAV